MLFRLVAAAYERRSLAIASHWPFKEWGRFLPEHSTAVSLPDRLVDHNNVVAPDCESYRMREARSRTAGHPSYRSSSTRGGTSLATSGDRELAIDIVSAPGRVQAPQRMTSPRPNGSWRTSPWQEADEDGQVGTWLDHVMDGEYAG